MSKSIPMAYNNEFAKWLGKFQLAWSEIELTTSFAVGKLLGLTDEEAHLVTTRMPFAVRASLLRSLVARKKPESAKELITALNQIQNESKRNVFAHSFILSNENVVTFHDRNWEGDFVTKPHSFTLEGFKNHVVKLYKATRTFNTAIGVTQESLDAFAKAALSANAKAQRSPVPPKSSA
jgi:hypothetical protein